jgi:Tfp pilus assembly protein FimT
MLWHYRRRAEECASRIKNTRSEAVRQNYLRLLVSWNALIEAEEARLSRVANAPERSVQQ